MFKSPLAGEHGLVPREPRQHVPGSIHHVTAHGVDTRPLFADDLDRGRFVGILSDVTRGGDWRCLAFCCVDTRDEHFHHAVRYLARNPCEAGLCSNPAAWPWSSYAALVGAARAWSFVSSASVLSFFAPQPRVAVERVRRFVEQVPGTVPGTLVKPGARRP